MSRGSPPAATGKMYVTNNSRKMALDVVTGKKLWDRAYEGGCDRMAIAPEGSPVYLAGLKSPRAVAG